MKTAFLILANNNPEHLSRLVSVLNCSWAEIFIRIDNQSDINDYASALPDAENIHLLQDKQYGALKSASYSVVHAVLFLLFNAYILKENYQRFCLLSGTDYPIKSMDEIRASFETDTEFMRVDQRLTMDSSCNHVSYVQYHYFIESDSTEDEYYSGKIERDLYDGIAFYHGSMWWSLTRGCVNYILDYLEDNPEYTEFHKTSLFPAEIYFHSIVKSSPYAKNISHDFEEAAEIEKFYSSIEHGCHLMNCQPNMTLSPEVLTAHDLQTILNSDMLFAKKFDYEQTSLLDVIDNIRHQSMNESTIEKKNDQQKYIFVLSHMRSYSTLMCHLLGSNSDISGYAEAHLSYEDPINFYALNCFVRSITGDKQDPEYFLDKVLDNTYQVSNEMLGNENFRYIFLLRKPEDVISSILYMYNGFNPVEYDAGKVEDTVNYYLLRLKTMMIMAMECRENFIFIKSEDIIECTNVVLSSLSNWLGLSTPLKNEYEIFSHTGVLYSGDPSKYIKSGKVVQNSSDKKIIAIPDELMKECQLQYQKCCDVLEGKMYV